VSEFLTEYAKFLCIVFMMGVVAAGVN